MSREDYPSIGEAGDAESSEVVVASALAMEGEPVAPVSEGKEGDLVDAVIAGQPTWWWQAKSGTFWPAPRGWT